MIEKNLTTVKKIFTAFMIVTLFTSSVLIMSDTAPAFAAKAKKPARVKITSAKLSGTKIIVKWKKAAKAKKYQVWRKIGTAKWKRVKTQKSRTYKFKAAKGKVYRIKVRGVNGKKPGRFSAVKKVKGPKKSSGGKTPSEPDPVTPIDPEPSVKIVTQPEDATVKDGGTAIFTISAQSAEKGQELTYQWFRSRTGDTSQGTRLQNETSPELQYRATILDSGMYFFCIVTCGTEKVKTAAAKLTVLYGDRAYIISQPKAVDAVEGDSAELSFEAKGGGELTYQWYVSDSAGAQGGEPVPCGTEPSLKFKRLYLQDNGRYYYCVVTNTSVVDGETVVTETATNVVKISVTKSPLHTEAVNSIKAFIAEQGVLSTETVSIGGLDFYVIANEKEKALLLAKQPSSYYEHSISDNGRWDCNYEGLNIDGESPYYDEDGNPIGESGHYGAIVELNTDYLDKNPVVDMIASPTSYYTLSGEQYTADPYDYCILSNKVFLLTQGDVTGMYAGENSAPYDYTFNMSQHWQHFGNPLPKEIVDMYVDGEVVPWFVRSPYAAWDGIGNPGRVVAGVAIPEVEAVTDEDDVKAYARPAFWVDLSE